MGNSKIGALQTAYPLHSYGSDSRARHVAEQCLSLRLHSLATPLGVNALTL